MEDLSIRVGSLPKTLAIPLEGGSEICANEPARYLQRSEAALLLYHAMELPVEPHLCVSSLPEMHSEQRLHAVQITIRT